MIERGFLCAIEVERAIVSDQTFFCFDCHVVFFEAAAEDVQLFLRAQLPFVSYEIQFLHELITGIRHLIV